MAMGGGGSTYRSADGIWHAAIDIEPDRATGRRRRLTAQGKTKAVANARLRMKLDAYVRKGFTPNSPSPRLMDWLETWYHERAEANLRPNSRRSYENAIVRVFCQVGVGRFGVSFSPCERRVSGRFGVGRSCWLLVIALVIA